MTGCCLQATSLIRTKKEKENCTLQGEYKNTRAPEFSAFACCARCCSLSLPHYSLSALHLARMRDFNLGLGLTTAERVGGNVPSCQPASQPVSSLPVARVDFGRFQTAMCSPCRPFGHSLPWVRCPCHDATRFYCCCCIVSRSQRSIVVVEREKKKE